jgi:hypothetical protein
MFVLETGSFFAKKESNLHGIISGIPINIRIKPDGSVRDSRIIVQLYV